MAHNLESHAVGLGAGGSHRMHKRQRVATTTEEDAERTTATTRRRGACCLPFRLFKRGLTSLSCPRTATTTAERTTATRTAATVVDDAVTSSSFRFVLFLPLLSRVLILSFIAPVLPQPVPPPAQSATPLRPVLATSTPSTRPPTPSRSPRNKQATPSRRRRPRPAYPLRRTRWTRRFRKER